MGTGIVLRGKKPRGAARSARGTWKTSVLTRGQWPRGAARSARGAWRPSRPDARPMAARKKRAKKNPRAAQAVRGFEMEVGGALLSRAPGRSIIAAGALNGRVRDGNGCLSPARATNQKIGQGGH